MTSPIKYKVLVTSSEFPEAGLKILLDKFDVIQTKINRFDASLESRNEIESLISGVDGIIWCTKVKLDKYLIEKAGSKLKIVSAMSAGIDQIDKEELNARNIKLTNTPDVLNGAVADIAILLMIGALRRLPERLVEISNGEWDVGPQRMLGRDVQGNIAGIIGLGGIGKTIVKRLKGFDLEKIIYTGPSEKPEASELGVTYVSFEELLASSDIIFTCCSLNKNTHHLMNAAAFAKMKKTSIIVNISRGEVIDQDALVYALKNKQIYAAGLDVTTPEPIPPNHPLNQLPNCFVVPHMGSATQETRNGMAYLSALNLILGLQGETLLTPVV